MDGKTPANAPESKGERERRRDLETELTAKGAVSQGGRDGGRLAREIGTEDELKRAKERPASATRVTKANEQEDA
ncbi:hypothetical protein [Pontivivens insulae]|uniref:Uncharacterized protein n=1 Tax=Pontivivens insulae TaxID=1639689 RepID=A0A2R8ACA6_9RHOB|nr:hypothetical protein [Pontivivens insulae]RED13748.1 hypothetical protein DFR53_1090 [Pontivivens insulae]SPF29822.1 hypothetical protein POI8812_02143 [Pontivivens insulae]